MSLPASRTDTLADLDLLRRIRIALSLRIRGQAHTIQIDVDRGHVTLRGVVHSSTDQLLAYEATRRIPGVHAVTQELRVAPVVPSVVAAADPRAAAAVPSRRVAVAALTVASLLAVLPAACGKQDMDRLAVHPVSGKVLYQGQPLANALVVLHPKDQSRTAGYSARGQTGQDGQFQVTTYDTNDGAPEGEYAVTVQYYQLVQEGQSYSPGPNVLPPKLAARETTDIVVRVAAGANSLPPIEVSR